MQIQVRSTGNHFNTTGLVQEHAEATDDSSKVI